MYLAILVILTLCLGVCSRFRASDSIFERTVEVGLSLIGRTIMFGVIGIIIIALSYRAIYLQRWYDLANSSDSVEIRLNRYKVLNAHMRNDGVFLLYYAKNLLADKQYGASLEKYAESKKQLATIAAELGMAKSYSYLGLDEIAEIHYQFACDMVPNKFAIIYIYFLHLVKSGKNQRAKELGNRIIDAPIKVNSMEIELILKNVSEYMNEIDNY